MISIFCNNEWLTMPPDPSIRVDEEMPQFSGDVFQGDYSFPFDLPMSPANARALGYLNLIDVPDKVIELPCEVFLHNISMGSAILVVQKAWKNGFTVNIAKGLASFSSINKKLTEFNYGGERTIGTDTASVIAHANDCVTKNYPEVDYNFPMVRNNDLYGNANPDFSGVINRWSMGYQTFLSNKIIGGPSDPELNPDVLIPFPYLLYVLKACFAEEGYEIAGTFVDHPDVQQMLLYSNRGLDAPLAWEDVIVKCTGMTAVSENTWVQIFYDTEVQDIYDSWDGGTGYGYIHFLGKHQFSFSAKITLTNALPGDLQVRLLIDGVVQSTNTWASVTAGTATYTHTFEYVAEAGMSSSEIKFEVQLSMLLGSGTLTVDLSDLTIHNDSPGVINAYSNTLNVANHVPDITLGELLRRLRGAPFFVNITRDFLRRKVYLDYTVDSLSSPPEENITDKVAPGGETTFERVSGYTLKMGFPSSDKVFEDNLLPIPQDQYLGAYANLQSAPSSIDHLGQIIFVQNLNQYWISKIVFALPQWAFFSDRHPEIIIGDGSTELKAEITPLLMRNEGLSSSIVPHLRQKGQSTIYSIGTYSFQDTRIIIWKGLQDNYFGQQYPFASSVNRLFDGTVFGSLILRNDGTDGLFDAYQSRWLEILMRGEIQREFINYNINDLMNFIGGKKQLNYQTYLIRKRSTVYGKTVSTTEVEMLKL